ncbi:hypothetical protein E3P86_04190 [Wallemia ichthyophaga]|uniref:Uncharacterized protein n=1 Tax=Wallemia ichthyophaga TaxID=245174 RepID=A0A4T0I505_WALIC|nr:hypothetical protein E3P86_04190 [Wallemia ichthyophaga]
MIEVIKSDDAKLLARELCDRYPNTAQLNIYRYENAYRGFTPPKKKLCSNYSKAISRQLQEEYHTSKEFNTHITPDLFHTALLSVISNYRPNHEPNLRVMLEATSEIDELNGFDLVLEEIFFTAIGTARIGGYF